jgi:rRNA-processing protein FCF1
MDNQPEYNAAEAAKILLKDYRERRQAFHAFDNYDEVMMNMRKDVAAKIEKLNEPLKKISTRLFSIADKGFFLCQVCEWKLDYLAEALIHAVDAKNPLALANNARGLLEHVAALVVILKELEQLENNLRGQGQEKAINDALAKAEKFIHRGFYGKNPKLTNDKNEQALHINDCLKTLKKEVADIEDVYDFLSEYVHPNYGSNLLVSSGQLGRGKLNPPAEFHRETLDRLCRYCSHCMLFLKDRVIQDSSVFVRLQDLLEMCFFRGAKLTNVFSIKTPKPDGDGKSRDTAFCFPKARTHMEAIRLCYEFLEKEGYKVQKQAIGDVADGFIYDVYTTDKGMVWFKVPEMKS